MIEVSRWPAPAITALTRGNRKVGLGVMGFAELLILLGIPYASERALALADELMHFLDQEALAASRQLADERGVFPNLERSVDAHQGLRLRNATRTSVAPTGTISIIAGTSASIEPLFALAYRRENVLGGETLTEVNPLLLRHAREKGFHSEKFVRELQARGSLSGMADVPPEARELFRTALEIAPEDHLRVQAAFQKHTDNAVSKTINVPQGATVEDVAAVYRRAWEWGLKGITVFRYGSKGQQVLHRTQRIDVTGQASSAFMKSVANGFEWGSLTSCCRTAFATGGSCCCHRSVPPAWRTEPRGCSGDRKATSHPPSRHGSAGTAWTAGEPAAPPRAGPLEDRP